MLKHLQGLEVTHKEGSVSRITWKALEISQPPEQLPPTPKPWLMLWWGQRTMHICGEQTRHTHLRPRGENVTLAQVSHALTKNVGSWFKWLAAGGTLWGQAEAEEYSNTLKKIQGLLTLWGSKYAKTCKSPVPICQFKRKTEEEKNPAALEFMGQKWDCFWDTGNWISLFY